MLHISLFSGIGGFDLAAQWMGWTNIVSCEINDFGNKVLEHYWPNAYHHRDVKTLTLEKINEQLGRNWRTDDVILTGGFPCQDASVAMQNGKGQKGIQGERTGLIFEMFRLIREIKPRYIVAENVANILKINEGSDFTTILTELSAMGYNAEWRVCRASEIGAPHKRARLYLVAYPSSIRLQQTESFFSFLHEKTSPFTWKPYGTVIQISRGGSWKTEPPILCLDDGLPSKLVRENLKGYGNSIVPQIAYNIFKGIENNFIE